MTRPTLSLEIVTPDGMAVQEREVDVIVLRRRETRFEVGSEIAIFPRHGPMLVRLAVAPVRYHQRGGIRRLTVGGGFAEIRGDRVRLVSPWVEPIVANVELPSVSFTAKS
jgi:F-type H+-transporting ATPase subunit epsilon